MPQTETAIAKAAIPYKIALLGDSTTQFLNRFITENGELHGYDLDIYEAGFNQVEHEVFDASSGLYQFAPNLIVIAFTAKKVKASFYKLPPEARADFHLQFLSSIQNLVNTVNHTCTAKVLSFNLEELDDTAYGHFANKYRPSLINQLRRINVGLMDIAEANSQCFILDIARLHNQHGTEFCHSPNIYINTDLVHSVAFSRIIAEGIIQIVNTLQGKIVKCLVIDLDNTLWGGIIGDDGLEKIEIGNLGIGKAFQEFQYFIKHLRERGIILAICSKNTEEIAREPFNSHPEMVLKMDDIAVFVANWENKADNITFIQQVLNIGFDSMVFLDDNPMERELVKSRHPTVIVPDLPEDPAYYLPYLQSLNLFETVSIVDSDSGRTLQYQEEAKRKALMTGFNNIEDFLSQLHMSSYVRAFNKFDIPRIAQLSQRSNQFNLTTIRYTESDVTRIADNADYATFAFNLKDNLGDHGLICVIILKKQADDFFIESWMMSCRVLKRTMENFCLNTVAAYGQSMGAKHLIGEYIPTEKNALVKDHYLNLGFTFANGLWYLNLDGFTDKKCFIETEKTK